MPIQHTVSSNLLASKEILTNVMEKQVLENLNVLPGQESLATTPHFGEVLSNLHEVQSKSLSPKSPAAKTKQSADLFGDRHHQNRDSVSHDSLVKGKEVGKSDYGREKGKLVSAVEKRQRGAGKKVLVANSKEPSSKEIESKEIGTKEENINSNQIHRQSDQGEKYHREERENPLLLLQTSQEHDLNSPVVLDCTIPTCLKGEFIGDTLQEINNQQALTFGIVSDEPVAEKLHTLGGGVLPSGSSDFVHKTISSPIYVQVQAAAVYTDSLLDDQQIWGINGLTAHEVGEALESVEKTESSLFIVAEGEEEQADTHLIKAESQIKAEVEKATATEPLRPDTLQRQPAMNEVKITTLGHEDQHISITDQSSSFAPGRTEGGIAIGEKPEIMSSFATRIPSNLERVNTLMQVKDHFRSLLKNQESHLKVNLTPRELGAVEITIDIVKDRVMATFIKAEQRETMELLARHAKEIDKIFQEAGLQSDLANMNFSSQQDQRSEKEKIINQHTSFVQEEASVADDLLLKEGGETDVDSDALVDIKA